MLRLLLLLATHAAMLGLGFLLGIYALPIITAPAGPDQALLLLAFQFGGESRTRLPPGGEWRCLYVAEIQKANTRDGAWHAGTTHRQQQRCVEVVDLDINIHVRRLRCL